MVELAQDGDEDLDDVHVGVAVEELREDGVLLELLVQPLGVVVVEVLLRVVVRVVGVDVDLEGPLARAQLDVEVVQLAEEDLRLLLVELARLEDLPDGLVGKTHHADEAEAEQAEDEVVGVLLEGLGVVLDELAELDVGEVVQRLGLEGELERLLRLVGVDEVEVVLHLLDGGDAERR